MANKVDIRILKKLETAKRRKFQTCKIVKLKIDKSHLSKKTSHHLKMLFVEAKWVYNYILSQEDIFAFKTKDAKQFLSPGKDGELIERSIHKLSSQMAQQLKTRICTSIKTLSDSKKSGNRVGRLKYRSKISSIPLIQHGSTFKILENSRIKIQGLKPSIRVRGLNQIKDNYEISSAQLIDRNGDYFIHIVCWENKTKHDYPEESVGIDFGISSSLTLSNGESYNYKFPITNSIKRQHKKLSRKLKHNNQSKNIEKQKLKLRRAYDKRNNQKKDAINKIVSYLTSTFETICVQDESIAAWQKGLFGKQISESILGGIMSGLKKKSHTLNIVDKWFPSTKICHACGQIKEKMSLCDREYHCDCGYIGSRDINAAINILYRGLNLNTHMDHMRSPVENSSPLLIACE